MDIQKEREDFEKLWTDGNGHFKFFEFDQDACKYRLNGVTDNLSKEDLLSASITLNTAWLFWLGAKAQAVPEGFVLVPKEKISYFWQDNDEPENFCSNESDFDCLGDCIDLGEIIEINKFTQAHVNKEKLFGTWFAEAIDPSEKANFFVGTHAECLEIVAKNKAMIEAQEPANEN